MSVFGDQTGSHREFQDSVDNNSSLGNSISDNLKNMWQVSKAQVMSCLSLEDDGNWRTSDAEKEVDEDQVEVRSYTVLLLREQKEIMAIHKQDNSYWALSSFPKVGDFVNIRHKRDKFEAEIIENITVTEAEAMAIFAAVTKKAG